MRPSRERTEHPGNTYFVTSQTWQRRSLFRNERWARLLKETLESHRGTSYKLHAFVLMPDHFHLLLSPLVSLERSVQMIKGGFSFRAKREFKWGSEIWQPGFSDHRIRDLEDWCGHVDYMERNPVASGLCERSTDYPYLAINLDSIPQRLKPDSSGGDDVRAEARTLHTEAAPLHTEARTLHTEAAPLHTEARTLLKEGRTPQNEVLVDAKPVPLHAEVGKLQVEISLLKVTLVHEKDYEKNA